MELWQFKPPPLTCVPRSCSAPEETCQIEGFCIVSFPPSPRVEPSIVDPRWLQGWCVHCGCSAGQMEYTSSPTNVEGKGGIDDVACCISCCLWGCCCPLGAAWEYEKRKKVEVKLNGGDAIKEPCPPVDFALVRYPIEQAWVPVLTRCNVAQVFCCPWCMACQTYRAMQAYRSIYGKKLAESTAIQNPTASAATAQPSSAPAPPAVASNQPTVISNQPTSGAAVPSSQEVTTEEEGYLDIEVPVVVTKNGIVPGDIGRRVKVDGYRGSGYLRFVGPHVITGKLKCGVELDEPGGCLRPFGRAVCFLT